MSKPNKSQPLLGMTPNFEEAFPEIEDIFVQYTELGDLPSWEFKRRQTVEDPSCRLSKSSIGSHVRCTNPNCKNGGYNLEYAIRMMVLTNSTQLEDTLHCSGKEPGNDCCNFIKIKIEIVYKN